MQQLQPYGNIYDLVGGTAGLLDARMHSAKVNGAYRATARYDTPQHAQQALSASVRSCAFLAVWKGWR